VSNLLQGCYFLFAFSCFLYARYTTGFFMLNSSSRFVEIGQALLPILD